ncbi:hypothetical protein J2X02_002089 [Pseudoxanthomonas japonensis]|uniref:COG3904 family protein n=1 Tax=Pseudoxanthomonas japonensis TaxID=69284 RepID=UPI001A52A15A|nr:hypothetical protein [Pseudoxanthomonas mexicana]MDR7069238.1 hypothetical protein [Pseudoxanthomonas japonensis]
MPSFPLCRLPLSLLLIATLGLAACRMGEPDGVAPDALAEAAQDPAPQDTPAQQAERGDGAVSTGPLAVPAPASRDGMPTDWPVSKVVSGKAWISCQAEYNTEEGDGTPLESLAFFSVVDALSPCQKGGVLRLRYQGKIAADFTDLVSRVADIAGRMDIHKRILDLDSAGGQVEDAIKAGDAIGASGWTIWVREGSVCHSACVFVLGAGDNRMISGKVGVHRIIRMSSTATTRAELNEELRGVYDRVKDYLSRNGVAVAVADLMMTVPNRRLRLLSKDELQEYGLDGTNAAQDDLDRLQLMRRCGGDFVMRRDAFMRSFDSTCKKAGAGLDDMQACGLELRTQFGFPDAKCPADSPLSEFDRMADSDDAPVVLPESAGAVP